MSDLQKEWYATLTPKEKELHALAAVKLKAEFSKEKGDSGSYFPKKSHAFLAWLKIKESQKK